VTKRSLSRTAIRHCAVLLSALCLTGAAMAATEPDNTDVNKRDRDSSALTPLDQSNTKADVEVAAAVRDALTDDKSLSVNAHNVKVIVRSGVVTLRGPVANAAEKERVEAVARGVAGVTRVDSALDVNP
jgi:hyperosmotically inducible periplasmic protein